VVLVVLDDVPDVPSLVVQVHDISQLPVQEFSKNQAASAIHTPVRIFVFMDIPFAFMCFFIQR